MTASTSPLGRLTLVFCFQLSINKIDKNYDLLGLLSVSLGSKATGTWCCRQRSITFQLVLSTTLQRRTIRDLSTVNTFRAEFSDEPGGFLGA